MPEPTKKMCLTVNEAAEQLDVSPDTIYRPVSQRLMSSVRVGKLVRLKREHLDAYLEKQTVQVEE
jgi:excisionase family DNA binding protein